MLTWNNRVINRALAQFNTRQKYYKDQLYDFLSDYKNKQKVEDLLDQNVKEG